MTKNDFMSTIGYDGAAAVVDKERRAKNGGKTVQALLDAGAFRSAAAAAVYDDSPDELALVTDYYNKAAHADYTPENILRVFGITKADTKKTILL